MCRSSLGTGSCDHRQSTLSRNASRRRKNLRRTKLAQTDSRKPLSHVHTPLQALALRDTCEEATSECITCAIGVVDLLGVDLVHGESLDVVLALHGDDGGLGALRDYGGALALLVLLREVREVLGDGRNVLCFEVVGLGVGFGFGLVADDVVPVRRCLVERVFEELADEWCIEGKGERLCVSVLRPIAQFSIHTLFSFAASSAIAMIAGTQTVKWKPPTKYVLAFWTVSQCSFKWSSL